MGIIYEKRKEKGWSQEETARRADISYPTYHAVEHGKRKPNVANAKKIGKALGFPWWKIFEEEE